jgi:hypothetical protein
MSGCRVRVVVPLFKCRGRDSGPGWVVTQCRVGLNRKLWQLLCVGDGSQDGRKMDS